MRYIKIFQILLSITVYFYSTQIFAQEQAIVCEFLEMSFEELMNVELTTAGKRPEVINEIPASVVIITREDIQNYGYRSISEILQNVNGLYSISDIIVSPNLGVRGFCSLEPNANIVYLVNGVNQVWGGYSFSIFSIINIPVEAIDRIEVIKGPASINYGSGAFYGVINVITNQALKEGNSVSTSNSIASDGTYDVSARLTGRQGDLEYTVNIGLNKQCIDQPFNKILDSLQTLDGSYTTNMGSLKDMTRNFGKHCDISGSMNGLYTNISLDEGELHGIAWTVPVKDHYFNFTDRASRFQLGYKKQIADIVTVDCNIQYSSITRKNVFAFQPHDWGVQYMDGSRCNFDFNMFITPSEEFDIAFGLNRISETNVSNYYDIPDWLLNNYYTDTNGDPIITNAVYSQIKYKLFKNVTAFVGLRLEQMQKYKLLSNQGYGTPTAVVFKGNYNNEKISVIPRLSTIFNINKYNVVKFMYGEAISRPSFFENHDMLIWFQQKVLQPEWIKTYEMNYLSMPFPRLSINFSVYHNSLENLIVRNQGFDADGKFYNYRVNAGEIITKGVELQVVTYPIENMKFDLAMSYQDSKDIANPDIELAYAPKILGYFKAFYNINKNVTTSMIVNYMDIMKSEFSHTPVDQSDPNSPPIGRIGNDTNSYFNVNANLKIKNVLTNRLVFNLRCTNILNVDMYSPTTSYSAWSKKGIILSGRVFTINAGYEFK
ncbi:TonB-dependent receptor plug domain-containing protein [bacterium]|nr:TonB-dependent receptor plug domain-containing protein [bacterium]